MNTLESIASRRSIRKFTSQPVSEEDIQKILAAAIQAPSGKNNQPWRFVVIGPEKRSEMIQVMRTGIENSKNKGVESSSCKYTLGTMEQAPVTIFVFCPEGIHPWQPRDEFQVWNDVINHQSIGAAIQNMLLTATELGLGSLWICDVFFAYEDLRTWMGEEGQMIAAVSIGYANQNPPARPRKPLAEVVRWIK